MRIKIKHIAVAIVSSSSALYSVASLAQETAHQHQPMTEMSEMSAPTLPLPTVEEKPAVDEREMDRVHAKQHGGQIYQLTTVEAKWVQGPSGHSAVQSDWETWLGTDENKVFFRASLDKPESEKADYSTELLYSRNVADFWDVQAGVRYRYSAGQAEQQNQVDAVLGLYGMAPYFFETKAYLYAGQEQQLSLSLHSERDILLTQKLITQPHIDLGVVLSDESKYAQQSGISHLAVGLETRYEISKKLMPFVDISYQYQQGRAETAWQSASTSDQDWYYAVGLRAKF